MDALQLSGEQVAEVYDALEERGVEVGPHEAAEAGTPATPIRYTVDNLTSQTTDACSVPQRGRPLPGR